MRGLKRGSCFSLLCQGDVEIRVAGSLGEGQAGVEERGYLLVFLGF